ncbi:MAG: hypothetical protein ABL970_17765 [Nitrospira sp.]
MAEHDLEKLLGGFAADTLTPEERQQLFTAALQDQQLFDALADEQALKELLTDPVVRQRLLQALNKTTPVAAGGSASWMDWFRRPANLALAGGLAAAVFAVVLGTRIYQDSLQQAAQSVATETAPPAQTPAPIPPAPSQPVEPKSKEPETPARIAAKKDGLTDKLVASEQIAPSPSQEYRAADGTRDKAPKRARQEEDRKQAEAPLATSGNEKGVTASVDQQLAASSPAVAPEPKKSPAPASASLSEAGSSTVSARALFYGEAVRADTGGMAPSQERAMKPSAESESQSNAFTRKLEGLSQLSKAASPATPIKQLGLRYSFVTQTADGQEQEIDAAAASNSSTPVHLTIEANQDGYIQVWQHVGSSNTQLLLPQKDSGHISLKIQAGQRQRLPLPADHGTVIVRLSRVPFGPISRQEAALLNRLYPTQRQESVTPSSPTPPQERATYVVSQDPSPTAQIAVDILLTRQQ